MNRSIKSLFPRVAVGLLFLMVASSISWGQQAGEQLTLGDELLGATDREKMILILANEIIVAPGIGLNNVRLGEDLNIVLSRLGTPLKAEKSSIFIATHILNYKLDNGVSLEIAGREVVQKIVASGRRDALLRTAQGARFGMDKAVVQGIYGEPTKRRKNRLEYKQKGIAFDFVEGKLVKIEVYSSK